MITNKRSQPANITENQCRVEISLTQIYSKIYDQAAYKQIVIKKINFFLSYYVRMINLSLNELKVIAKSRYIKDYKNKSENDLIKILSEPKPKIDLSKNEIKEIKKDFSKLRYGFSKSEINEFRRSLNI